MITFKSFSLDDYKNCIVVTDEKIAKLYGINDREGIKVYLLPEGERAKSFDEARRLCSYLMLSGVTRTDRVVAIGGGSIGDVVGFVCSVYKRGGVRLTHVPTTLLAQIDSSIGGKTALDVDGVKNAVGTYYQADTVIDVNFLKTLDEVQLKSGLGELFKYRMLSKKVDGLYNGEINEGVIKACVEYKQRICEIDPFDGSIRKRLNFGHTLGHAIELSANVAHGRAVAIGMYYETTLAYKLGKCDREYYEYWTSAISDLFEILPFTKSDVYLTKYDKKNSDDVVCFVLPDKFEDTYLTLKQIEDLLC